MRRAAFSLVEMAITAAIMALLAGSALLLFEDHTAEASRARARGELDAMRKALHGRTLERPGEGTPGLAALLGEEEPPADPWGNLYELEVEEAPPEALTARGWIRSGGPNGMLEPPDSPLGTDDLEVEVRVPNPAHGAATAPGPDRSPGTLEAPTVLVPAGEVTLRIAAGGEPDGEVVDVSWGGRLVARTLQLREPPGAAVRVEATTAPALLGVQAVHEGAGPPCRVWLAVPDAAGETWEITRELRVGQSFGVMLEAEGAPPDG